MVLNDTIAAIATPIGEGGIGVIRLSGPDAVAIAAKVLRRSQNKPFPQLLDRHVYHGWVVAPDHQQTVDEVLFFLTRQPHSYTAEDVVEIQGHGGLFIMKRILETLLSQGARLAEPGEFTQRAFLNGRIDLVQAEAIIDLIRAKTEKTRQLALHQLQGEAGVVLHEIEAGIYKLLIAIEAVLDFPEEGLPDLQKETMLAQAQTIGERLAELIASTKTGQKIRDGLLVVISGPPNVGKSSLLNAFLGEERAIVTEIPGTTRDAIEVQLQIQGIPVRLIDTAGLRETENVVERIGISKAKEYMETADLILLVLDGSRPVTVEEILIIHELANRKVIIIINKTDLPQRISPANLPDHSGMQVMETSLMTGEGVARLKETIQTMVGLGRLTVDEEPILTRVRHLQSLETARTALDAFMQSFRDGITEDLLAGGLRTALEALGAITGKNVTEEVIHGIFAQFCIGK